MKNNKEQIEDQLMDALLHEQQRKNRDEIVHELEQKVFSDHQNKVQKKTYFTRYALSAAACVAMGVGIYVMKNPEQKISVATTTVKKSDHEIMDGLAQASPVIAEAKLKENLPQEVELKTVEKAPSLTYFDAPLGANAMASSAASSQISPTDELTLKRAAMMSNADAAPVDSLSLGKAEAVEGSGVGRGSSAGNIGLGSLIPALKSKNTVAEYGFQSKNEIGRKFDSNTERYGSLIDPAWMYPNKNGLSTFSIDVDNASYTNLRRLIQSGAAVPADAVRIEECINAFDYNYEAPKNDDAFAVHSDLATCPWADKHLLLKVGIKGKEISADKRPASNLVFLIDVSGSMNDSNKLPLVKDSLKLLLHQLDERDTVSYVVYAGSEGVALPPTKLTESGREKALNALNSLESGGSTNGAAGINLAYQFAKENFIKGGVNRVILATDGDFNVGITDKKELVNMVKQRAAENIYLSVLGFGVGNLNDELLEDIAKDGNGNHFYIDNIREGRKVFLQRLSGTLVTIAKDVKIQIEFNPAKVGSYRLIGYANRVLKDEDFNNDKVDAGDIGAGHTVTAFYEIITPEQQVAEFESRIDALKYQEKNEAPNVTKNTNEWLTLKLRHKQPEGDKSSLQESVVTGDAKKFQETSNDFQFASAVAMFGMKLRGMDDMKDISWSRIKEISQAGMKDDKNEMRAEFVEMINRLIQ